MRRSLTAVLLVACVAPLGAQRRTAPRRGVPPPPAAAPKTADADVTCPTPLGIGILTKVAFCDVLSGRDPKDGLIVKLPPHAGPVTLTFDLHNRQTYSEEQVKAKRAYTRYTATVGVLTMDNTLLARGVVQNEFRKASDLVDRIGGGAGPAGIKAVAPTGTEHIVVTIPEAEDQVSILGEKVTVERLEGTATYSSPGRPIAVVSNVKIEYRPAPPPRPRRPARGR